MVCKETASRGQAQLHTYQISSKTLHLKMPLCPQYKVDQRLFSYLDYGRQLVLCYTKTSYHISGLYIKKRSPVLPEKEHTVSFPNMSGERQIYYLLWTYSKIPIRNYKLSCAN
ncbi:mCG148343 [Mus musculus]|uniref:Uncharacterized protein n=1 Tax=Mus musculus TaxID=10090 RepID=Q8BRN3_MOUSE|nr:mCG148343 [Mus musculus]BAC31690.1 unnamed protein product [Mus musculus]